MPLASWLFVRGSESIWIERPAGRTMLIAGPGGQRDERAFQDEESLQSYQIDLATRLTNEGWFLWGVDRERREARDRRQAPRTTTDRRRTRVDVT
jgi:hypothetical protein